MIFTSETVLDDGLFERRFILEDLPGILWSPGNPPTATPLILLGHPGGLAQMHPRLLGRARSAAALGYASLAVELPGSGDRPPLPIVEEARVEVRRAVEAGLLPSPDVIDALILPLVDRSVPEWQATLDVVLELPEIGGPVAYSGGVIAIGTRLARVEPRIVAAGLFAGSFIPRSTVEDAREVSIPLHVLLQWDDRGNDRQAALDLFDAFGSTQKTLQANLGGHTGVPRWAGEDAARFFARHLG